MKKLDKSILGVAGELAVASELCRRNIYAQLTFGNQKRTDLLIFGQEEVCRIEVKSKQGNEWPGCKGIKDKKSFLVFVDYKNKEDTERPDFYVLSYDDWKKIIKKEMAKYKEKNPNRKVEIEEGALVYGVKGGEKWRGHAVKVEDVKQYQDKWDKIEKKAS